MKNASYHTNGKVQNNKIEKNLTAYKSGTILNKKLIWLSAKNSPQLFTWKYKILENPAKSKTNIKEFEIVVIIRDYTEIDDGQPIIGEKRKAANSTGLKLSIHGDIGETKTAGSTKMNRAADETTSTILEPSNNSSN